MYDIRTITLDLDDTLWAIDPVIERAERKLREWLRDNYPRITEMFSPQDMYELRGAIADEHPDKVHDFTFLRRAVLGQLGTLAGYGDGLVDGAMTVFSALRNDVEVFPEVRPALRKLRQNYCVIAVTNGNADLSAIGLRDLFDDVISAASAGVAKPAREIFDVAVQAGGAVASETLHVGDHPEVDVVAAQAAGLKSVWVNRGGRDWPDHLQCPDGIVRDVGELLSLLGVSER
ncbi:MAG: HAD family hydrolase [Gammaproteobacteria bacterium]|nr:HAD family hydrolase [Gammaproteobacteria bacterium]